MNVNRRQFSLGLTAATLTFGSDTNLFGQQSADAMRPSSGARHRPYFFKHPTFEYVFLTSLGRAYHMAGNVGKVLYLSKQIEDGNFESAFQNFKLAGDEARSLAEESHDKGHHESARQASSGPRIFMTLPLTLWTAHRTRLDSNRPGSFFTIAG